MRPSIDRPLLGRKRRGLRDWYRDVSADALLSSFAERPACHHCLKSASLRGIPHDKVRCYYRAFDADANEVVQDWPDDQVRGKCSISWTGPAWVEPPPTPEDDGEESSNEVEIKVEGDQEGRPVDRSETVGLGWDELRVTSGGNDDEGDQCDSPLSTTYTRLSSPSTAPTSPATSPSVLDKDASIFWATTGLDVPRPCAVPVPWTEGPQALATATASFRYDPPPSAPYYSAPPLDAAAFQNSSLFGPPPSVAPYGAHLAPFSSFDPAATLPSPAATPPPVPASLPYPFRLSFSPNGHTTTLCPAPPPSPLEVSRRKGRERRLAPVPGGGFWSGGPLSRSELLGWEGLGRLRGD